MNSQSKRTAGQSSDRTAKRAPRQSGRSGWSGRGRSTQPERYERGTRSYTMSHIRGKDTKIEVLVRSYLFRHGLRFRKNDKRYPGHPDVVLPKYRTIVFVNGCFWHMHEGCAKHSMPKSNVEFWSAKLVRNHDRDVRQHAELRAAGWKVIVVWECELAKPVREERLARLVREITGAAGGGSTGDAAGGRSADGGVTAMDDGDVPIGGTMAGSDAMADGVDASTDPRPPETGITGTIDAHDTRIGNGNERKEA